MRVMGTAGLFIGECSMDTMPDFGLITKPISTMSGGIVPVDRIRIGCDIPFQK